MLNKVKCMMVYQKYTLLRSTYISICVDCKICKCLLTLCVNNQHKLTPSLGVSLSRGTELCLFMRFIVCSTVVFDV